MGILNRVNWNERRIFGTEVYFRVVLAPEVVHLKPLYVKSGVVYEYSNVSRQCKVYKDTMFIKDSIDYLQRTLL